MRNGEGEQQPLDPIGPFARVYAKRAHAIAEASAARAGVVAYIGGDVPRELALAAGLLPLRLMGESDQPRPDADALLGARASEAGRSLLQLVLDGACDGAAGLVIGRNTEELVWLFYALRALHRLEPARRMPRLHLFDLLHLPHRSSGAYSLTRARQLLATLEQWSGRTVTADDLREAIAASNRVRRLRREVRSLRLSHPPRLGGVEALQVTGAGVLSAEPEYQGLLEQLLQDAPTLASRAGRRVFVTGGPQDTLDAYWAIEAAGAVIVGEDHEWGDADSDALVDERAADPLEAIVERYRLGPPPGAKSSISMRASYTARRASECGAELVVCFIRRGDCGPRWDVPDQREALQNCGIPMLLLDDQDYRVDAGAIAAQVKQALAPGWEPAS